MKRRGGSRRLRWALVGGAVAAALAFIWMLNTPEAKIRALVESGADAAEEGDMERLGRLVAEQYAGPVCSTKAELLEAYQQCHFYLRDLKIKIRESEIEIAEDVARVRVAFRIQGTFASEMGTAPISALPGRQPGQDDVADLLIVRRNGRWGLEGMDLPTFHDTFEAMISQGAILDAARSLGEALRLGREALDTLAEAVRMELESGEPE